MNKENGMTLFCMLGWLIVLAFVGIIFFRGLHTFIEYRATLSAIEYLKDEVQKDAHATKPRISSIREAFDRQANVGYITSIEGKDLDIMVNDSNNTVSIAFDYDKVIPLIGPVSLIIHYRGSTYL